MHDLFAQRVNSFKERLDKGEDVTKELNSMLVTWLFNHIKRDDLDYVDTVKAHLQKQNDFVERKRNLFARLFG